MSRKTWAFWDFLGPLVLAAAPTSGHCTNGHRGDVKQSYALTSEKLGEGGFGYVVKASGERFFFFFFSKKASESKNRKWTWHQRKRKNTELAEVQKVTT